MMGRRDSRLPSYLLDLIPEQLSSGRLEQFPAIAALGQAIVELEMNSPPDPDAILAMRRGAEPSPVL
jgi:hypothetical protein